MRTYVRMHSDEIREAAAVLRTQGLPDAEGAAELGLARSTVRDWRLGRPADAQRCHRCWHRTKPVVIEPESYAELLGLYLGDGCISRAGRTYRLRLSLDANYPGIVEDACAVLRSVFP